MNYSQLLKVAPGARVKLKDIDPAFKDNYKNPGDADQEIAQLRKRLQELQELLYAERRHALLICLQAVDTGGKDGTNIFAMSITKRR